MRIMRRGVAVACWAIHVFVVSKMLIEVDDQREGGGSYMLTNTGTENEQRDHREL